MLAASVLLFAGGAAFIGIASSKIGRPHLAHLKDSLAAERIRNNFSRVEEDNRRLHAEASGLQDKVLTLQRQLSSLEHGSTRARNYEKDLKDQLRQLSLVVRSASSLGIVSSAPLLKESSESKNVRTPKSESKSARSEDFGRSTTQSSNQANIGGAEIDCSASFGRCHAAAINPATTTTAFSNELNSPGINPDSRIVETLSHYLGILRTIPMGAPAQGEYSSLFGLRSSPFGEGERFHEGLDISVPHGTPVVATGDGRVLSIRRDPTYGLLVDVKHSDNVVSRYAHLAKTLTRVGQSVGRGQILALSGSTGRSTGPHLHYEVRIKGSPKDPIKFFKLAKKLAKVLQFEVASSATSEQNPTKT